MMMKKSLMNRGVSFDKSCRRCGVVVVGEHPDAEHEHRRNDGHDGEYRVHSAAVGDIGDIRDPGVERRVVCRRAEEGHHAVEYDEQGDYAPARVVAEIQRDGGEEHYRCAPDEIACGDERLAFAELVDEPAREDCRHRRGEGGEDDHEGGHREVKLAPRHEEVLPELGEEHVFHHPGYLTDKPEDDSACPDSFAERRGFFQG